MAIIYPGQPDLRSQAIAIFKRLMTALTFAAVGVATANAVAAVDPAIKPYVKTSGVSGNLSSVGSDTLANLMTMWAEAQERIPGLRISRFRPPVRRRRPLR